MNDEIQNFINAYRDSLGTQRDLAFQNLENTRRNAYQSIMSSANNAGMMYSNFPERAKIQYDTNTYMPAKTNIQNTYQTGLDTLRSNIVNTLNSIKDLKDATTATNTAANPTSMFKMNDSGDYFYPWENGVQFRNAQGDPIRFGTAAQRAGYDPSSAVDLLGYAQNYMTSGEWARLNDIWSRAHQQGATGFTYNVGDSFTPNTLNFLDESERGFLDSLGLSFSF